MGTGRAQGGHTRRPGYRRVVQGTGRPGHMRLPAHRGCLVIGGCLWLGKAPRSIVDRDRGPWTMDHGPWTMDHGCWMADSSEYVTCRRQCTVHSGPDVRGYLYTGTGLHWPRPMKRMPLVPRACPRAVQLAPAGARGCTCIRASCGKPREQVYSCARLYSARTCMYDVACATR